MKEKKYKVFNCTRNACVAESVESASSIFKRMKGLIGRNAKDFSRGQALWIRPSDGIHTFGMRFPIDAAYLDAKGKVIRLYHDLPPFRVAAIVLKARSVLELPAGTLAQSQTEVGDILDFQAK